MLYITLALTLNIKLLQSKFMKIVIKGEQMEWIQTHYLLSYNNSINNYWTNVGTSSLHYKGFALMFKAYKTFTKEFSKNLLADLERYS